MISDFCGFSEYALLCFQKHAYRKQTPYGKLNQFHMFIQFHSLLTKLSKLHENLSRTKQLHALITKTHLSNDPFYATRIIRFYAINKDIVSARNVFDKIPHRSVYLWNSIIRAYAQMHEFGSAFRLFKKMRSSETEPDNFTFACVIRACSENFDLEGLRLVHGGVIVSGLGLDYIVSSALVTAYSNLGSLDYASRVFSGIPDRDLVLWNSMIMGYGYGGFWGRGLELFSSMRRTDQFPDGYTLVGLVSGLADPSLLGIGQGLHGYCLRSGLDSNAHVGSVLVSMYSRCKCMNSACTIFRNLSQPDLITWSALITGFSQSGIYWKALLFFKNMNMEGKKADSVLLASLLATASQLAIIGPGAEIHGYVIRHGYESGIKVSSSLIDMYSKCGFLHLGIRVFEITPKRNIVSYNSVISSLGLHGLASEAFEMFDESLERGFEPDEATFSALLCACCHAGLVEDGREYFRRMNDEFGIRAKTEHYVHMIKLLGMDGKLEEAYDLVRSLIEPVDSGIWGALLSCCDVHGDSKMAEIIGQRLIEQEPVKSTYRVMLSNVYAGDGKWEEARTLREDTEGGVMQKIPGLSWIGTRRS